MGTNDKVTKNVLFDRNPITTLVAGNKKLFSAGRALY
jgi:hypothetical protein